MSKKKKLLNKFLDRPESVGYSEVKGLLFDFGFGLESKKGSHRKFRHQENGLIVVVSVHGRDCKRRYKTYIAEIFKKYFL